ncbi:MAG: recombinase family protein [Brevundimonas sp.]|nr:MAG: recombinase family protein [Brevundimonas sp.]
MSKPPALRCAIYTRKSSEEGLEQEYNSLHAQRDSCEAYVRSQVGEGWSALKTAYDDGGISGGTMDRPGLKQLLADIAARRIDVVVVYKVDRLTRSLWDFAKIVEVFDKHGVSFVSVTQSFNTTSSMGRLTLNMLLSFAQFEREVTSERIRDKISASKKKGMWMGGQTPLGYDAEGRTLKINEAEADSVRHIYRRYLELKSVHRLVEALKAEGVRSKRSVFSTGRTRGGCDFDRGALFNMLSNPVYLGRIRHKTEVYDGLHPPIIDQETFDQAQVLMAENARRRGEGSRRRTSSPLMGILFDENGERMTPTFSVGRGGKSYRYYVSASAQRGQTSDGGILRAPGPELEHLIDGLVSRLAHDGSVSLSRVDLRPSGMELTFAGAEDDPLALVSERLADGERAWRRGDDGVVVFSPARAVFRGGRRVVIGAEPAPGRARPDRTLVEALRRAHKLAGPGGVLDPAVRGQSLTVYDRRLIGLAFLAPDLQRSILSGTFPRAVTLAELLRIKLPARWSAQRETIQNSANH